MSYTTMHLINTDGDVCSGHEYQNAWHGAMLVWDILAKKYRITEELHMMLVDQKVQQKIWDLSDKESTDLHDRIVLASTFDCVVVKAENIPYLIHSMKQFMEEHAESPHCHIAKQAEDLEKLINEEIFGVCWTQTSVAEAWYAPCTIGNHDGEGCPTDEHECDYQYNLNRNDDHWFLFDKIPKPEL